ncbi:MAG TPA: L,D-transpeptidase family protein, partial [Candidatus Udaeobacter sp.]
ITTRIIWLRGLEAQNAHAFQRCIYIHGTPEENKIGRPASYGCIRMKSKDVAELYDQLPVGAVVQIIPDQLPKIQKMKPRQEMSGGVVAAKTTPQAPPQATATKIAKATPQAPPQIAATKTMKTTVQAPPQMAAMLAKVAPERAREVTATKAANVTPEAPPQISASMLAMPPSSSLSLEQMRTAGALAGARQKAKLAANKRL